MQLRHALALGLAQGPTELLPVSSSAHTALIPLLLGWPYAELDGELRKSFELALHAGAGLALALDMRGELTRAVRLLDRAPRQRRRAVARARRARRACACVRMIERRLGGPRSIAAGLTLGGLAHGARRRAGRRAGRRADDDAGPADGLALGLAQAVALAPGVSRYGATLVAAARAPLLARRPPRRCRWHAALPVMLGASALEGARLLRRRRRPTARSRRSPPAPPAHSPRRCSALACCDAPSGRCARCFHARSTAVALAALVLARTRRPRTAKPSSNP